MPLNLGSLDSVFFSGSPATGPRINLVNVIGTHNSLLTGGSTTLTDQSVSMVGGTMPQGGPQQVQWEALDEASFVRACYWTFLGRSYDWDGYTYWCQQLVNGMSRMEVVNAFAYCAEAQPLSQGHTAIIA